MKHTLAAINGIVHDRERRKQVTAPCTENELGQLRSLTGELNYVSNSVLPPEWLSASELLQRASSLTVADLAFADHCLRALQKLNPTIRYNHQDQDPTTCEYLTFANASLRQTIYGQTGYFSGVHVPTDGYFYPIDWISHRQSRICFSSMDDEILADEYSVDRGLMMQ